MGLMKKFSILFCLFLLISVSLFSTSFAGRRSEFMNKVAADVSAIQEGTSVNEEEEVSIIHERLLRANTRDYGRYDPSPTFSKPPFKLIPN
ncbi:hypothetical protein HN51_045382 [Arachis hypogaea]|uniref:Uncharacterized protein n=1 Tax=Arachis hypogaea TaxID=3818 RepID=A0A444XZ06_ARAHY|nr:protein CASPARIAN STRIP INTEGRITY FACTOR 1 [Arachis ipaensis]XP_025669233.1 protein CASPARIAN STRIP INTEGRITY FACTOR 1 [Arachis hypogaea]QHN97637.1 uncharacterized protein DS421_18g629100 [Arachis hypogaea]RYQ94887.1 hypothetical protein Ahy_B08g089838 [Arachis hypogaea]